VSIWLWLRLFNGGESLPPAKHESDRLWCAAVELSEADQFSRSSHWVGPPFDKSATEATDCIGDMYRTAVVDVAWRPNAGGRCRPRWAPPLLHAKLRSSVVVVVCVIYAICQCVQRPIGINQADIAPPAKLSLRSIVSVMDGRMRRTSSVPEWNALWRRRPDSLSRIYQLPPQITLMLNLHRFDLLCVLQIDNRLNQWSLSITTHGHIAYTLCRRSQSKYCFMFFLYFLSEVISSNICGIYRVAQKTAHYILLSIILLNIDRFS